MKKIGLFPEDRARQITRYLATMAVIAVVLDLDLESVNIKNLYDRDADTDGSCRYRDWKKIYELQWKRDHSLDRLHAQRTISRMIILKYSPLATLERLDESDDDTSENAWLDIEPLMEFLIKHSLIPESFRTPDLYEEYLAGKARDLVEENWYYIEAVTDRLMREIILSEDEIIDIMDKARALEQ